MVREGMPVPKPERKQKNGHALRCPCASCIGRRNRLKGMKAQRAHLKALAAATGTVRRFYTQFGNEESAGINGWQVESKKGKQVPALLVKAFRQCESAIAIGSGDKPAVILEPEGTTRPLVVLRLADFLELVATLRVLEAESASAADRS